MEGEKAKKVLDLQREVGEEFGVDLDKAMDKDYSKRNEKEEQAIEEFKKRLKLMSEDKNDIEQQTETAKQEGSDLAGQTEIEDSQDFTEKAKAVNERQASARAAWAELVKANPDVEEWMRSNPDFDIADLRENFGDSVADAWAEMQKGDSMKQGFVDHVGQSIEDTVKSQTAQAQFTGKINGEEVPGKVLLFTDADGNELTLVGGSINEITHEDGSHFAWEIEKGGIAIFRDKDGNLVQKTDMADLREGETLSAEDYANVIRQRLQEQKTAEIQSTETPLPEGPKEEPKGEGGETPTGKEGEQEDDKTLGHENDKSIVNDGKGGTDSTGNVLNSDGSIYTESVKSIEEIADDDFDNPTRSIELPAIPQNVSSAIGADGKPVIIKKNIFEKNATNHPELDAADSRAILTNALYNPNLIGQTQPVKRPSYKVAVQTGDKHSIVVLDVYNDKKQVEIVGWRLINEKGLAKMKRQAEREGGQFLILSPKDGSAAALSALPQGLSSNGKGTTKSSDSQENNETLTFKDGTPIPMDEKGEPDFTKMTPEQGAVKYQEDFGGEAESVIDGEIKQAEKDLKDAKKRKIEGSSYSEKLKSMNEKKAAEAEAQKKIDTLTEIKKALTLQKVAEGVGEKPKANVMEDASEEVKAAVEKFLNSHKVEGRHGAITLADGTEVEGTYQLVEADALIPSHDPKNGFRPHKGAPLDAEGRTVNDRDYEHEDKAQDTVLEHSANYNGKAVDNVPVVLSTGHVISGVTCKSVWIKHKFLLV